MVTGAGTFRLRLERPSDDSDEPLVWTAVGDEVAVELELPDGSRLQVQGNSDPLWTLKALSQAAPKINVALQEQRLEIACPAEVESALPLWLTPVDERGPGSQADDDFLAEIEDRIAWADYSSKHYVFVNGDPWAAISAQGRPEPAQVVVPLRGTWPDEWFADHYGSLGFTESASRTSGWDSSTCGLITPRVFAIVDRFDEGETYVTVRPSGAPTDDFRDWIWSSELLRQFRETWTIPAGDDDFIEWGFLQLVKSGRPEITIVGLDPLLDDMLGVGLTSSSEWTFTRGLPSDRVREALGDVADRRPGGSPAAVPRVLRGSPREQLEEALLLPEEELVAEGWSPTAQVDREMFIAIFNARPLTRMSIEYLEIEKSAKELGWPAQWEPGLCGLWLNRGGTVQSARKWAEAGWHVEDILKCPRLSRYWNPPMPDRLAMTEVPSIQALDTPPPGVKAWPDGDLSIAFVLEVARDALTD